MTAADTETTPGRSDTGAARFDAAAPAPTTGPAHGSRMALAIAALEASRGLLRHQMLPPEVAATPRGAAGGSTLPGWLRPWRRLRRWLLRWPAAEVAGEAVQGWWHHHPLRPVADVVAAEWRQHAVPVVRRHPVLTVSAAAALGALVATARPWRWPVVAREIAPLPSRAGRWLMSQLSSAPMQTALATLAVMASQQARPADADSDADAQLAANADAGHADPQAAPAEAAPA